MNNPCYDRKEDEEARKKKVKQEQKESATAESFNCKGLYI